MYADLQRLRLGFCEGFIVTGVELFHKSIGFEQSGGIHITGTDQAAHGQPWRFHRGGC